MMKRVISFICLICMLTVNTGAFAANVTKADISFNFTHKSTIAANQYAVWIENSAGSHIKTLSVTNFSAARRGYRTREDTVSAWVKAANPDIWTDSEIDAVSSATPSKATVSLSWDMTDTDGNRVKDGIYRIQVEGTMYWSSNILYTAEFDTRTAKSGELTVSAVRNEPDNRQNKDMLDNVHITLTALEKEILIGDARFEENSADIPITVNNENAEFRIYAAVYTEAGYLKSVNVTNENISGTKTVTIPYSSDKTDRVIVYVWDGNMSPYCEKIIKE